MKKIIKKCEVDIVSVEVALDSHKPIGAISRDKVKYIFIYTHAYNGNKKGYVCFMDSAKVTVWSILSISQIETYLKDWDCFQFETISEAFEWLNKEEVCKQSNL